MSSARSTIVLTMIFAQRSLGNPKIPEEMAQIATDSHWHSLAAFIILQNTQRSSVNLLSPPLPPLPICLVISQKCEWSPADRLLQLVLTTLWIVLIPDWTDSMQQLLLAPKHPLGGLHHIHDSQRTKLLDEVEALLLDDVAWHNVEGKILTGGSNGLRFFFDTDLQHARWQLPLLHHGLSSRWLRSQCSRCPHL